MKKLVLLILSLIILPARTLFSDIQQIGTTSNNFLKILAPAKPVALGEGYAALAEDVHSMQFNPAGVAKGMIYEISFTHINWFQNIMYENINFTMPFMNGNFGLALNWMRLNESMKKTEIDLANPSGYKIQYDFSPYSIFGTICYAGEFSENTYIGANLKILNYSIDEKAPDGSAMSFMADLGLLYDMDFLEGGTAALVFKNIGPATTFKTDSFMQPINITGGLAYRYKWLALEADAEYYPDNAVNYSVGAQITLYDAVDLRAGFKGGTIPRVSYGGGIKVGTFTVDYAFVPYQSEDLGTTHRVTASYAFGAPECKLSASPWVFSPNNDKIFDFTRLKPEIMSKGKAKKVTMKVYNKSGKLVFTQKNIHPTGRMFWKGLDQLGMPLADGRYGIQIEVDYGNGIVSRSNTAYVEIDNTPPQIKADAEPKEVKPGQTEVLYVPVNFTADAYDLHGIGKWKVVITEENGSVFKTISGQGEIINAVWDGIDDTGLRNVDTGKTYTYTIYASDKVGNWGKSRPKQVKILLREVVINLSADTLFDVGKADVKISVYSDIKKIADQIKSYENATAIVEGHTDNQVPRFSKYATNYELSQARAEAVIKFFVEIFGLDENRFKAVGMGDTKPVADNSTPEGRKQNRRVTIRIKASKWE